MNWMSIIGLCLIVLGTVFSFFGTFSSNKKSQDDLTSKIQEKNIIIDEIRQSNIKLIDQNSSLLNSNNKVSTTNMDLIDHSNEMLNKISIYQQDLEERNIKIQELEKEILNVKKYSYYADYNIYGTNIMMGLGLSFSSDLSNRMKELLFEKDGKTYVKNLIENLPLIDEVIEKYPYFPFGYFTKFDFLKAHGNPEWKKYAQKAVEIFEVTTTIPGHNESHDEALRLLKHVLK